SASWVAINRPSAHTLPAQTQPDMPQRVILITGANGGLGQAIAKSFLAESPDNFVCLGINKRRDKADALVTQHRDRCQCIALDVMQPEVWKKTVSAILIQRQRLDVLVNNAGFQQDGLLANLTASAWHDVIAANLDSVFHGCQAVLPAMISQRGGRIVNISSL